MVKKTRDRFIEVARSLFARKGVENTTMNDIATASDKGRRTIYTYFKSKREIFNAVIESETDDLLRNLRMIVAKPISPEQKLYEYVETRLETCRATARCAPDSFAMSGRWTVPAPSFPKRRYSC